MPLTVTTVVLVAGFLVLTADEYRRQSRVHATENPQAIGAVFIGGAALQELPPPTPELGIGAQSKFEGGILLKQRFDQSP